MPQVVPFSCSDDDFVPSLEELPDAGITPPPKQKSKQAATERNSKSPNKAKGTPSRAAVEEDGAEPPTATPPSQKKKKRSKQDTEDGKESEGARESKKQKQKQKQDVDASTPISTQSQSTPLSVTSKASSVGPNGTPKKKDTRKFTNGFVIHNSKYGPADGKVSKKGKTLVVSYVGKLSDSGKVFDKTKGKDKFEFVLGAGQVIKGWDKGLEDMRVGDSRTLTVPPSMGYGAKGSPPVIPPNSTLVFDITLANVK